MTLGQFKMRAAFLRSGFACPRRISSQVSCASRPPILGMRDGTKRPNSLPPPLTNLRPSDCWSRSRAPTPPQARPMRTDRHDRRGAGPRPPHNLLLIENDSAEFLPAPLHL